jgi:small GTP-binding protein
LIKLKIWDTAGQERFKNITQQYYKNADGILLIFDLSNKETFDMINKWMYQIKSNTTSDNIAIVLVGNKCDVENRQVSMEDANKLAYDYNIKYFETSALQNIGISEMFVSITEEIVNSNCMKESRFSDVNKTQIDKSVHKINDKKCC